MTGDQGLAAVAADAAVHLKRLETAQRDLAGLQGTATSPRGYVTARTGPGGRLLELTLGEGASRIGSDALVAELTAAIGAAQAQHDAQAQRLMADAIPAAVAPSTDLFDEGLGRLDDLTATLEGLTRRLRADAGPG